MSYIFPIEVVKKMLEHWWATPPNGYIGFNYAHNPHQLLLKALTDDSSITLLQWMREDIPPLQSLNSTDLNIYRQDNGFDQVEYFIGVGSITIPMPNPRNETATGGRYYADAQ